MCLFTIFLGLLKAKNHWPQESPTFLEPPMEGVNEPVFSRGGLGFLGIPLKKASWEGLQTYFFQTSKQIPWGWWKHLSKQLQEVSRQKNGTVLFGLVGHVWQILFFKCFDVVWFINLVHFSLTQPIAKLTKLSGFIRIFLLFCHPFM